MRWLKSVRHINVSRIWMRKAAESLTPSPRDTRAFTLPTQEDITSMTSRYDVTTKWRHISKKEFSSSNYKLDWMVCRTTGGGLLPLPPLTPDSRCSSDVGRYFVSSLSVTLSRWSDGESTCACVGLAWLAPLFVLSLAATSPGDRLRTSTTCSFPPAGLLFISSVVWVPRTTLRGPTVRGMSTPRRSTRPSPLGTSKCSRGRYTAVTASRV